DQHTFTTAATAPWAFGILHPQQGDSTELEELELSWNHAPGADSYLVHLEQNGQSLYEESLAHATDTSCTVPLSNAEYYTNMDIRVTAVNEYGETLSKTNFYKKFRTGIEEVERVQESIALKNFPNPFSRSTTFHFNIPESMDGASLKLTIYTLKGEKVTELLNETAKAGNRSIEWENSGLPQGIYAYRISLGPRKYAGIMEIAHELK
ncbi:MAG: T9SS type A sorting domain-containing protein, partial [Prolixibacteraceae bacterium]|nr:T9SS type A sorting domain-containing protein [Prolixibacteraceae bacterium]